MRDMACQYPTLSSGAESASNGVPQAQVLGAELDGLHMSSQTPLVQVAGVEPLSDFAFSGLEDIDFNNLGDISWLGRRVDGFENSLVINYGQMIQNPRTPEVIFPSPTPVLQPAQTPQTASAALANHSMEFIFLVVRTWPKMLADESQLPPLVHPTQVSLNKAAQPLAHCITLSKMWHGQCEGAEQMVYSTILRELDKLLDKLGSLSC